MTRIRTALARWLRRDDGTATIEFVLCFPVVLFLLFAAIESSMYMARYVMLDRALDMTVRELRLGILTPPNLATIKTSVCSRTLIISDCANALSVQLEPVAMGSYNFPNGPTECIDRSAPLSPPQEPSFGVQNQIMTIRACVTVDALFPTTGLTLRMSQAPDNSYFIVAASGFVNEP